MGRRPRLGQHFLTDERVVQRSVGYAELSGEETVLEVGPGRGVLTRALAEAAGEVVAVELDQDLARDLEGALPGNVRLVVGDALEVDLPRFDACVSNLPYQISSPFTFRLLDTPGWSRSVLMFQREFAERLAATPGSGGEWGRLAANVQLRAEVEVLERVPPGAFDPPPRVESALVRLVPRGEPAAEVPSVDLFEAVVQAVFLHRRKTVANGLVSGARFWGASRDEAKALKSEVPHGGARPGVLDLEALAEVAWFLHGEGFEA